MSDLSFGIKSTKDLFLKLTEDHSDFLTNKTSSRFAVNCALTAWHLTDWFYHENHPLVSAKYNTLLAFQTYIKTLCHELQIMHDIANGTKHLNLTKHKSQTKEAKHHKGVYSKVFSRAYDISALKVEMNDGKRYYFEDVIKAVIDFWDKFIDNPMI